MLSGIVSRIHWIIILYTLYNVYISYEEHITKVELSKSQIPVIQSKIKKAEEQKGQLKDYFNDIEKAKKRIESVAIEVEKLQKKLPTEILDAENLELLSREGKELNIKNVSLSPQDEQDQGFYFSKNYNFKGTGTYLQFLIFLERISQVERLLNISKMTIVKSKNKQKGRFQLIDADITVESYRYNPNFKESRGIDEIEKKYDTSAPPVKPIGKKKKREANSKGEE